MSRLFVGGLFKNDGKISKYESDDRHFLYKEYSRILAEHQPSVFVMENVTGLLSAELQQRTFDLIRTDLQNPAGAVGHNSGHPNILSFQAPDGKAGLTEEMHLARCIDLSEDGAESRRDYRVQRR